MRGNGLRLVLLGALALCGTNAFVRANEAAAWTALREGGHVALLRHADAPGPVGDPPGFKLEDCATQRNLSSRGRTEAAETGRKLRAESIAVGRVASSPWCRCLDTATLMEVGPVTVEDTFSNAYSLADQRQRLTEGARRIIADWQGPGTLIVVTHGSNILALTGVNPASAEMTVVRGGSDGSHSSVVGRISFGRL